MDKLNEVRQAQKEVDILVKQWNSTGQWDLQYKIENARMHLETVQKEYDIAQGVIKIDTSGDDMPWEPK